MTVPVPSPVKRGWCPTLDRPMASGDGLLVRVQPRRARLSPAAAEALADAATRFGNGIIELTGRGNLQLRGLRAETLDGFAAAMEAADIPSPSPLLLPPLLGDDPGLDSRTEALVSALERAFADDPRLRELPGKFAVAVDGGGLLGGLLAGRPVMADLVATPDGRLAPPPRGEAPVPVGRLGNADPAPFGLAPPFAQFDAAALRALAVLAARHETTIRVTPWRALLLGRVPRGADPAREAGDGWITDPADPRLLVSACVGGPGCAQGSVPARLHAARLDASRLLGVGRVHVSGCAKGCAHPGPAPLTLVGRNGRYDVVRNGRAGDPPARTGLDFETATR